MSTARWFAPVVLTFSLLACGASARASEDLWEEAMRKYATPPLPLGRPIRLSDGGDWRYGTLEAVSGDCLVMSAETSSGDGVERISFPLESIERLETPTGRQDHSTTGMIIGGVVGVAVGSGFTGGITSISVGVDGTGTISTAGTTAGGLIVGSVLGGLIGWAMQSDRWEEFSLGGSLSFDSGRPGEVRGLAILVRF